MVVSSSRTRPALSHGRYIPDEYLSEDSGPVDCVVHLAGRAHVARDGSLESAAEFRAANVQHLLNTARICANKGARRFIYVSSIGVLGDETRPNLPFTHMSSAYPQNEYALSKFEAETELRYFAEKSGMEYVIIRPPLVYGDGAKGNFATLIRYLQYNFPIPFALLKNRRGFVGVENLVDLIITTIDHPSAANRIFLVSDGEDVSTAEFFKRTARAMKKRAVILPVPVGILKYIFEHTGYTNFTRSLLGSLEIDISYTQNTLQWIPPVSFDKGLQHAVQKFGRHP